MTDRPIAPVLLLVLASVALVASGCTTSGTFDLPPGTEVSIYERPPVVPDADGRIVTKPFFWTAAGGVPYELYKDGEVVKSGRLKSRFRVVSIFWPPFALIYWPMGLDPYETHDLTQ